MSAVIEREFCGYCHGTGMRWDSVGEGWRDCTFCGGTGEPSEYE